MSKNKYIKYIIIVPIIILSCTDEDIISNINERVIERNEIVLTPEEFISIAYDNPQELTKEDISDIVFNFQKNIDNDNEITTRNSDTQISIKNKYYITENNNIISTSTITRSANYKGLSIPIFEVESSINNKDKSLSFVCGDERLPEVFFYIDDFSSDIEIGKETRYLLELSKKNILQDIQRIENIKSLKRDSTLYKIAQQINIPKKNISYLDIKDRIITTDEILTRNNNPGNQSGGISRPTSQVTGYVNPMAKVEWSQREPYNYSMPIKMIYDNNNGEYEGNIPVGCANVAVGILFTIVKPTMLLKDDKFVNKTFVDWEYVTSTNRILVIPSIPDYGSPKDMVDMITSLLSQIAHECGSEPFYEEKMLFDINTEQKYKKNVITQTSTPVINTINYLRNMVNFSGDQNNKFNGILAKQSLFEKKPIFLCGQGHVVDNNGKIIRKSGGHAWLIDGVVITKRPRVGGYNHYWSVNMGWGKQTTYFRTSDDLQDCDVVFGNGIKGENLAYYTREMTMLYNITRK